VDELETTTMRIHVPAYPGERYAQDAFANQIGDQVPFQIAPTGTWKLIAAEVSEDGQSADLTIEVLDPTGHVVVMDPTEDPDP